MKIENPNTVFFLDLPGDLRAQLDDPGLVTAVLEAVQALDGSGQSLESELPLMPSGVPRMMCTLLTQCLAVGVSASEEIEARIATDPTTQYLCAGFRPDAWEIRRFRRAHRCALEIALAKVLRSAWEFRVWSMVSGAPDCDAVAFRLTAGRVDSELTAYFTSSARERIQQAVSLDRMANDFQVEHKRFPSRWQFGDKENRSLIRCTRLQLDGAGSRHNSLICHRVYAHP